MAACNIYHGAWRSYWEMFGSFCGYAYRTFLYKPGDSRFIEMVTRMPNEYLVLYAEYDLDGFEGRSVVVYLDRKLGLMANFSDHCSCNGLEWYPEPTSIEALLNLKNENLVSVIRPKTEAINRYLRDVARAQNKRGTERPVKTDGQNADIETD